MSDLYSATLNPSGPNYDTWLKIFGSDQVPLLSPRPVIADLGDEKDVEVYTLNLKAMTLMQRRRLVEWVSERFSKSVNEIERDFDQWDFPIRAVDVVVSISMRAFV
jgi:hypothetical protein